MAAPRYEVFQSDDGEWYWHLKGGNGEVVASSEAYTRETDAFRAANDLAKIAQSTKVPKRAKG